MEEYLCSISKHVCKMITSDSIKITNLDVSSVCEGDSVIKKIIVTTGTDGKDMDKRVKEKIEIIRKKQAKEEEPDTIK